MRMRRVVSIVAILLLVVSACGPAAKKLGSGKLTSQTITVDGVKRGFHLYVPNGATSARPLVLVLHGLNDTALKAESTTYFDAEAIAEGFDVAYPQGLGNSWNAGYDTCCGPSFRNKVDDVGFLDGVLNEIESSHQIDKDRVYVSGFSNGAFMAYAFACAESDRIAAVGVVAGVPPAHCASKRPLPLIQVHGIGDTVIPFTLAYPRLLQWAKDLHCPAPSMSATLPVHTTTYTGCKDGTALTVDLVDRMGHQWPSKFVKSDDHVDATSMIWTFFAAHPL